MIVSVIFLILISLLILVKNRLKIIGYSFFLKSNFENAFFEGAIF